MSATGRVGKVSAGAEASSPETAPAGAEASSAKTAPAGTRGSSAETAPAGTRGSSPETAPAGTRGSSPEVVPPRRADARRNYDKLIAAATAAFAEHGADDVSLEEIARRAGVGIGTLYRHFPARQSLLEAVYKEQVDALDVLASKLLTAESPGDALAEWIRAFAAFGRTKRSLSAALVATIGKDSELLSACSKVLRDCTDALLERAQRAGAARTDVTSADMLRLTHGLIMATDANPSDPGQADRIISLVIAGVLSAQPGATAG
jgi:AcrR family transcriptional regulator